MRPVELISVNEYLEGEPLSEVRHEYIGGVVYAMAGGSEAHNLLAGNLFSALHGHLRGSRCRVHIADMKVRLQILGEDIFYYPDVMVACDPRDADPYFKRFPKVIVEVLSESTERVDRREKALSYQQIETLEEYVLVAQDRMEVAVARRTNGWQPEILRVATDELRLPSLDFRVPLDVIYEAVPVGPSA